MIYDRMLGTAIMFVAASFLGSAVAREQWLAVSIFATFVGFAFIMAFISARHDKQMIDAACEAGHHFTEEPRELLREELEKVIHDLERRNY